MSEARIDSARIRELYSFVLSQLNVPEEEIEIVAGAATFASLRGIDTHGFIPALKRATREIRAGIVKPGARITVLRETTCGALVDADCAPGPVAAIKSMTVAIEKAKKGSCGIVATRNCNHFGVASFYAAEALKEDMIGVVFCNSSPSIAPFGGREAVHGTNPMSFAIPAGEHDPVILDMSTSAVARGKIVAAARKGRKVPEGWALDKDGNPTTDPEAALEGVCLPMGGHKGYGLGLVVDVFTAALSGSLIGKEVPPYTDLSTPYGASYFMMAVNVESFAGTRVFKQKVDRLIDDCKSCAPRRGFDEVLLPGEIELREAQEREKEGIPVNRQEWREMIEVLQSNEVDPGQWESIL